MAKHSIGTYYRALVKTTFRAQTRARLAFGQITGCRLQAADRSLHANSSIINHHSPFGFTLIELLVVISVIAILAGILLPVFASARRAGQRAKCTSNLRQLALAMRMYADDNDGRCVPAAPDIFEVGGGLRRWHGCRESPGEPFRPEKGPLWQYLGRCGGLKECPSSDFTESPNAFEAGCGGYGYNDDYVGGSSWKYGWSDVRSCTEAALLTDVRDPSRTVMLTDAAMVLSSGGTETLIEYSFCEPPYILGGDGQPTEYRYTPSIQFRHNGRAVVAWCDGHVSSEQMTFTAPSAYGGDCSTHNMGWFGPDDNSLFDLR